MKRAWSAWPLPACPICTPYPGATMIPEGASRPFSADRDGFVIAEGAATLVIEELEHAKARGAHIYAEISGLWHDLRRIPRHRPDGRWRRREGSHAPGAAKCGSQARRYQLHQRARHQHGTERLPAKQELSRAFLANTPTDVPISSTKSVTGHLMGAAGASKPCSASKRSPSSSSRRRSI